MKNERRDRGLRLTTTNIVDASSVIGTAASSRVRHLRRPGTCSVCRAILATGAKVEWNAAARRATCLRCAEGRRREADARKAAGRLVVAANATRRSDASAGAFDLGVTHRRTAQRRLARYLGRRLGESALLLHDRTVPRKRGSIDHIAIAPSGVWVIDTKGYEGKVSRRNVGGWFAVDQRLIVDRRDRTMLVEGLGWKVRAVEAALGETDIPVHGALCFVGSPWGRAKRFQIGGVWVTRADKLVGMILSAGSLEMRQVERLSTELADRLPRAAPVV